MLTADCHCRPLAGVVHTNVMRRSIFAAILFMSTPGLAQTPAASDAPAADAPAADAPAADAPPAVAGKTMGVLVLESGVDGVPVTIDGQPAGETPLPGPWTLPAGEHKLELLPPGKPPEVQSFSIEAGQPTVIRVMGAKAAPAPVVSAKPPPPKVVNRGPGFSLATAGYITAGVGVLAIGGGVVMGLSADSAAADARDLKAAGQQNTRSAFESTIDDADRAAFLANLGYGIGGAALVAGAAMIVLASDGPLSGGSPSGGSPSGGSSGGGVSIQVSPSPGGAVVWGRF